MAIMKSAGNLDMERRASVSRRFELVVAADRKEYGPEIGCEIDPKMIDRRFDQRWDESCRRRLFFLAR